MNAIFSLGMIGIAAAAPDWSQWRGPTRDSQIHEGAKAWPERLNDKTLTKVWNVGLAEGYSSPLVVGGRVFTVETKDKKTEITRAFDRKTGEALWEHSWEGSMRVPFYAAKNGSWVRSTPAVDDKAIYVGGMLDVLKAIDVKTGKEIWQRDFPGEEKSARPQFGFVCSPLLDNDAIYVQAGSALRKVSKTDGKTIWKTLEDERAMFGSAFSSPSRATIGGKDQILVQTRMALGGVDPKDGKVLWSTPVKAFRGMNILTPTVMGDHLFTASYGGGSFWYELGKGDDGFAIETKWTDKIEGNMSSPVVIDGKVYLHGRDKRFHCLDPAAGKVLWSTKEKFGSYWSMVANGTRILALDDRGELLLIEADPNEFKVIDRMKVSEHPTWAHLAVTGDEVYVRDLFGITSYRWK
ncbi:MAG: PQQ-binding-like beta-propeller repeat protein [Akkermansiaceae bacterium]